jgi:hypothetical protein
LDRCGINTSLGEPRRRPRAFHRRGDWGGGWTWSGRGGRTYHIKHHKNGPKLWPVQHWGRGPMAIVCIRLGVYSSKLTRRWRWRDQYLLVQEFSGSLAALVGVTACHRLNLLARRVRVVEQLLIRRGRAQRWVGRWGGGGTHRRLGVGWGGGGRVVQGELTCCHPTTNF